MAALAINTTLIAQQQVQRYLDAIAGRHLQVHATIIHDAAQSCFQHQAKTERIQCLVDQQGHVDEDIEVFHHLKQEATLQNLLESSHTTSCTTATTTLVASPRRRATLATSTSGESRDFISGSSSVDVDWVGRSFSGSLRDEPSCVVWNVQVGVVDLDCCRPAKRRRAASGNDELVSEAKQFKGVRYRPDRKTWAAEMKPPKYKNKVSFGEFKTQAQAARVVDAAFHYYGKPHLLNFPDRTPEALAAKPTPAGLDEKELLGFVKEQAKWLANSVPSTNWVPRGRSITETYSSSQGIMCVHYHLVSPMPPSSSDFQQELQERRSE